MGEQRRSTQPIEVGTVRVDAFSDSVMAVIITIMAFELPPANGATFDAVRGQLPGLLVYVLSFVFVAIYWNNHHHLLRAGDGSAALQCGQTCSYCSGCRSSQC